MTTDQRVTGVLADLQTTSRWQEDVYKQLHAHPELSFQETETAALAASKLKELGYEVVEGIGRTGVVGIMRNGEGQTVLARADMDALPVKENTGLPYASTLTTTNDAGETVSVAHACGHDAHVTCLLGAAECSLKLETHGAAPSSRCSNPRKKLRAARRRWCSAAQSGRI